jgi:hypothetical protein
MFQIGTVSVPILARRFEIGEKPVILRPKSEFQAGMGVATLILNARGH